LPLRAGSDLDGRAKCPRLAPLRANRKSSEKAAPYIFGTQLGRAQRDNPINSAVHARVWRRGRIATGCNFRMRPAIRANRKSPNKAAPYIYCTQLGRAQRDNPTNSAVYAHV